MRSIWSHVFVFYFVTVAFGVKFKKLSPRLTSGRLVPVFSSRGFMLSGLTSKSLIHGRSPVCKVEDGGLGSCPCGWPSRAPSAGRVRLVRLRPWAPRFVPLARAPVSVGAALGIPVQGQAWGASSCALKIALAVGLPWFHTDFRIVCFFFVRSAAGTPVGTAVCVWTAVGGGVWPAAL